MPINSSSPSSLVRVLGATLYGAATWFAQGLNDWCHTPMGALLAYHAWWGLAAALHLPVALVFLAASFVYQAARLLFQRLLICLSDTNAKQLLQIEYFVDN